MSIPLPTRYKYRENKSVQKAVDKAAPDNLRSAGAYVRAIAMRLISTRRPKTETHYEVPASPAGRPPFDHARPASKNFRKSIVFDLTRDKQTALVGPRLMRGGMFNIARLHEFGGTRLVKNIDGRMFYEGPRQGEYGMLREKYIAKKDLANIGNVEPHADPRTGQRVFWVRIRTKTQRLASGRLYRRYMKKYADTFLANYPARPYMAPALVKALPKLTLFWTDSVRP